MFFFSLFSACGSLANIQAFRITFWGHYLKGGGAIPPDMTVLILIYFISLYTIQKSEPPQEKIDNIKRDSSDSSQTPITDLPVTLPPNQNVMEAQKQMLHFNQALQNNALQNIVNRDEMMNPPLDNSVHPMPSGF